MPRRSRRSATSDTHAFRRTYRSWLDAVGTPVAVQQRMMRHSDIRTTFNIYGNVVTDEMTTAGVRIEKLAFEGIGAQTERDGSQVIDLLAPQVGLKSTD